MTIDKFVRRNQLLAEYLAQIAERRAEVGWGDSAAPLNAAFREVLAAQERLLTAAERLLERCPVPNAEYETESGVPAATVAAPTSPSRPALRSVPQTVSLASH